MHAGRSGTWRTPLRLTALVGVTLLATLLGSGSPAAASAPRAASASRPVSAPRAASASRPVSGPGAASASGAAGVLARGVDQRAPARHSVTYDGYSFLVDGQRTYLWSGEFHYFRLPSPDLWLDVFQKMKAAGFNAASLYFDWGYHSPAPGVYDFTGVRDVDRLLDLAQQAGLYVIARPAPYINAEVDGGGLPGWLSTKDEQNRSADPKFLAYANEWLTQIDRILARHQLTNGTGTVIAYQVENEFYNGSAAGHTYIQRLAEKARADGITVPLTGNNNGTFNSGVGALDIDGPDAYPQGFDCSNPTVWRGVPDISYDHPAGKPLYSPEFQGGAFDPWGGPGYDKCAQLINDQFANVFYKNNIAVGATAQSFYMTYGGTNWGWLGMPQNYTSYDYGAAIRETRQLDPKYDQDKLIGYFTQAMPDLAKTDPLDVKAPDNAAIVDTARKNPDTGAQFHVLRHRNSTSTAVDTTHITVDLHGSGTTGPTYPVVPQQPGTAITLDGRDSHILVANAKLGSAQLQYSTSELLTAAAIGTTEVAVLYGNHGSDGETVLRYASKPTVRATGGAVTSTWNAATGDLRLNYTHEGLARVLVSDGAHPLLLLLADKATAGTFWRADTAAGPVLARGTHLLRTATSLLGGRLVSLTGDNGTAPDIEVFTSALAVQWNGALVHGSRGDLGGIVGRVPTAAPITLPALTGWRHAEGSPESQPGFDDSGWPVADKMTTFSVSGARSLPVLYADDYGFHTGNTWYRGRFRYSPKVTGLRLISDSGGRAQAFSAWLNGVFLGSSTTGSATFDFPADALRKEGDNIVSVLTVNMGHEEDYNATNGNKAARGLTSASITGAPLTTITWRLQGVRDGEGEIDPVRGPLSTGGLYGERAGWSLPGYPDARWARVSLPAEDVRPGVSWYRTDVALHLPRGQDTSLGLTIKDDPSRRYRAMLFVNGWMIGNYVNYLGPQDSFPVPNGILNPQGHNSIAIAVWNLDGSTGGLGAVSLTSYGSYASSLQVRQNASPRFDPRRYALPQPAGMGVELQVPDTAQSGTTFTATATVRVPALRGRATGVTASLKLPTGWTAGPAEPSSVPAVNPGGSATFTWQVHAATGTLPAASAVSTVVSFRQQGRTSTVGDERIIGYVPPPPAPGKDAVSDLPFLSATNGWGPVERDTSNGEQAAGDGRPITLNGVTYAKGLGAHAISDVTIYLGGRCTAFTASVGVDDEQGGAGTVTFSVVADGKALVTTPTLRGHQAATPLSVDVTGAEVLDLVIGDAGDGNGNDHGDWAVPTLTCT